MDDNLYYIVYNVINCPEKESAKSLLFGQNALFFNNKENFNKIISEFVRKKESIIYKVNNQLFFELEDNLSNVWNIIFLGKYVLNEWDKEERRLRELFKKEKDPDERRRIMKLVEDIQKYKGPLNSRKRLDTVNIGTSGVDFSNLSEEIELLKQSILINYLDGFNKNRIIVEEKDKDLINLTDDVAFPILKKMNYDYKKVSNFFYNTNPQSLDILLNYCENDINRFYSLPDFVFRLEPDNIKKIINVCKIEKMTGLKLLDVDVDDFVEKINEYGPDAVRLYRFKDEIRDKYWFFINELTKYIYKEYIPKLPKYMLVNI